MAVLPGEERYLRQPHRGSSDGVSCALDSRRRCPAPPGLMVSVRSVKAEGESIIILLRRRDVSLRLELNVTTDIGQFVFKASVRSSGSGSPRQQFSSIFA